jgi:hypothetical protein
LSLDIILFADHLERYQERTDWIEQLAPVWIAIAGRRCWWTAWPCNLS